MRDSVSLIDNLRGAGASVTLDGEVSQPFFSGTGQAIRVNGEQVQVYEYSSDDHARAEAARIGPDGSTIQGSDGQGATHVDWTAPPHFFAVGRIIALYLGQDAALLRLLTRAMGAQVAGQV